MSELRIARMVRACLAKQRFQTLGRAKIVAWHIFRRTGCEMLGYRCDICHGWHHTRGQNYSPDNVRLLGDIAKGQDGRSYDVKANSIGKGRSKKERKRAETRKRQNLKKIAEDDE
jgi:hypothetical protein